MNAPVPTMNRGDYPQGIEVSTRAGVLREPGRLLIQRPTSLLLPQSTAFGILGYWCGAIQEQAYVAEFDPTTGNPSRDVLG